jgi:hypothetical protein
MALGDPSSPARFLGGQTADARNLALKVYGGEVLAAFDLEVVSLDKHEVRTISSGKSTQFPKTWKATSEYHTPGIELLGTDIDTTEIVVTVDDILVSHVALADIDAMLSHFEVRSNFAKAMGHELAKVFDKNVFRTLFRAARLAADGPFPAGNVITDASLVATGSINGKDWIDAIIQADEDLFDKDVPDSQVRHCAVPKKVFNAIKWATDANGQYLILNRDFGVQAGGVAGRGSQLDVDGVIVVPSRNIPNANDSANTAIPAKYRQDFSTSTAVMWTSMAAATVKMMDIQFETERDTRRLEDFMVAKMLVGSDPLRPECAVEFKTA